MSNAELFAAVERWAVANYGLHARHVSIRLRGLAEPVSLPILAAISTSAAQLARPDEEERGPALPRCVRDILSVLRKAGQPLTGMRLREEMARAGYEWSERTIDKYLKVLMEEGTIENPADARPRGYRIAQDEGQSS